MIPIVCTHADFEPKLVAVNSVFDCWLDQYLIVGT